MDHDEVIEQLELAAVEPDGLARLMAGDTATAATVAGHLAGCDACTAEWQRLSRAVPLIRDVVRTTPPADLRDRTLAFVRLRGVARTGVAVAAMPRAADGPVGVGPGGPGEVRRGDVVAASTRTGRVPRILPWVAALAAVVVVAVATSAFLVDRQRADDFRVIGGLEAVTNATLQLAADPAAERVTLTSGDASASGSLLFSPETTKLVVVATGLERPPAGQEYRCWFALNGNREDVGKMFFADDLAYWVGDTPEIASAGPGTTFGVSLTQIDHPALDAPPVISGQL